VGLVFGLLVVCLVKANVLLGIVRDDLWYVSVLAFVAGWNERFVPEPLGRRGSSTAGV